MHPGRPHGPPRRPRERGRPDPLTIRVPACPTLRSWRGRLPHHHDLALRLDTPALEEEQAFVERRTCTAEATLWRQAPMSSAQSEGWLRVNSRIIAMQVGS